MTFAKQIPFTIVFVYVTEVPHLMPIRVENRTDVEHYLILAIINILPDIENIYMNAKGEEGFWEELADWV